MDIHSLSTAYASDQLTPEAVVNQAYDRIEAEGLHPVWISLVPRESALARVKELSGRTQAELPLYGIPFAVKDNIDVAGLPTTAACPAYAYTPEQSATVVERLEAAGAILIGKTNMDQFATGLVGTRTPYGACSSVFGKQYISGGSSAGSAVAVAAGLVSFSLGTDTAGSGRVPAMFNNLVGLKPTRGAVSTHGVVPACRSLDCISVFAETAGDAAAVLRVARAYDERDDFSRVTPIGGGASPWAATASFRFGVPKLSTLEWFGDDHNPALYEAAIAKLKELGGEAVEIDITPFLETAQLLYKGPWVAERYVAIKPFLEEHSQEMDATVAQIILGATKYSAADTFAASYRLAELKRKTQPTWQTIDVMLLPTAPRTYSHDEIAIAPVERNSHLGQYTNFVNLLDLSAVAVPAGFRPDGLPFGVSLIGAAFADDALLLLADRLQRGLVTTLGGSQRKLAETPMLAAMTTPPGCLLMAVVGAHLTGQPLNWQLTQRQGRLVRTYHTHPDYKFYALKDTMPPKPGLVHVPGFEGPGIEVEIWALPEETVGSFVDGVPPPLAIGTLQLEDGTMVKGFLAEPVALEGSREITQFGGWRKYLSSL